MDKTASYVERRCHLRLFTAREKSMPGFKALKDKLTILLGANAAGDFILKPVLFSVVKILGPFRINTKSTLPMFYKGNNKAWTIAHLFTTWCAKYFQPILELGGQRRLL